MSKLGKLKLWLGQLCLPATDRSRIEFRKLLHEDDHRPAINDDIVHDYKLSVVLGVEPKEVRPEQRRLGRVDRFQGCLLGFQLRSREQEFLSSGTSVT